MRLLIRIQALISPFSRYMQMIWRTSTSHTINERTAEQTSRSLSSVSSALTRSFERPQLTPQHRTSRPTQNTSLNVSISQRNKYPDRFAGVRKELDAAAAEKRSASAQPTTDSEPQPKRARLATSPLTPAPSQARPSPEEQPVASSSTLVSASAAAQPPSRASATSSRRPAASSKEKAGKQPELIISLDSSSESDTPNDVDEVSDYDEEGRPTFPFNTRQPGPLAFAYVLLSRSSPDVDKEQRSGRPDIKGKGREVVRPPVKRSQSTRKLNANRQGDSGARRRPSHPQAVEIYSDSSDPGFSVRRKSSQGKQSRSSAHGSKNVRHVPLARSPAEPRLNIAPLLFPFPSVPPPLTLKATCPT